MANEIGTELKINKPLPAEGKNITSHYNKNKFLIYVVVGVVGAIALTGFFISGGMLPNANIYSDGSELSSSPSASSIPLSDFGSVEGYVAGPTGLPATGASEIAYKQAGLIDSADKSSGYTTNALVLFDGRYSFYLPSGVYRITIAFPDSKNQIVENYAVWPGSDSSLDVKYQ